MARSAKYTAQLSALIEARQKERMAVIEYEYRMSLSEVLREVLDAGLTQIEGKYPVSEEQVEAHRQRALALT